MLIKFSPFLLPHKSDITHFTHCDEKSPVIYNDKCFTTSPFRQDRPKFHAYTICVLAIDPFLTLRVVFPAYRNILLLRKVYVKANVYLADLLQELKLGLE